MGSRPIEDFAGTHSFLSNFYKVGITYDGLTYPSVENAYQAAKTHDLVLKRRFSIDPPIDPNSLFNKPYPTLRSFEAKKLGKKLKGIRPDWDSARLTIMLDLLRIKFKYEPLKTKLLDTGDAQLVEGNYWHDTFWGVCDGHGENWLGRLLMKVREELRA